MVRNYLLAILVQVAVASYSPYTQIILRNKGFSYSLVGIIIAVGQAAAIAGPLVLSALVDRTGRTKPFIVFSALLAVLCGLPFFLSDSVVLTVLSIFLLDFFFWSINPLSDGFLSRKVRNTSFSYGTLRASGTFGYMAALMLFSLTGFPDERRNSSILVPFAAFLLALAFTAMLQSDEKRERSGKDKFFSFSWFPTRFYLFMMIVALTRIAQSIVEKMLSAYMTEALGLGNCFTLFIAIGALFEFICMIVFGKLLKKGRVTPLFLLFISAVGLTLRLLMYLIPSVPVFAAAQTLHGLTFGALHVAATQYIQRNVESEHYEVGMSIYWAVATNLPEMLGALCGGFVIDNWGYPALFLSYAVFPLAAAVLCILLRKRLSDKA